MKKLTCLLVVLLGMVCMHAVAELQGPVEYPEGVMMPGGREIVLFNLDEILEYKALPAYSQPEWMDKLVADGVIPPVAERLPEAPQVIKTAFMSDGPGVYGGILRAFSAVPTEGWNLYAGQTQGWFGINAIYSEELVQSGPTFLRKDGAEPLPNLATSWEWQEDGRVLVMRLIKGAKWSNGEPFNADDIMFTWNDIILDPNVRSWTSRSSWQLDGVDITLEALDPYTIKWTFPVAYPVAKLFDMDFLDFSVAPAHWLKPLHPKYNAEMDYVTFENSMPPTDLPVPSLGPWIPVAYKVDEVLVMRRNPYYWKVDDTGRQLPYLDELLFQKGSSGVGRTMGTMAGSLDHDNVENPEIFVEVLKKAQDPESPVTLAWGQELLSFELEVNQSASLGVKTDRDRELRNLFRDLRFRRAVSQAIDRDGLGQSVVRGPFLRPFPGGLYPGSIYFDRESVAYYPHSLDTAQTLLAEIGFKDTDGDNILNWTSGPLQGQNLVIQCLAHEDQAAAVLLGEALVPMLADLGIQINFRPIKSSTGDQLVRTGEWEMRVIRGGQDFAVPQTRSREIAPIADENPPWHRGGAEPRELQPFEQELNRLVIQFAYEPDFADQKALMSEYNRIFTENVYRIGLVIGRYGLMMSRRIQNVPVGTPPFLYQWDFNNFMPEQLWAQPADQLTETMPQTIPIYKK